MDNPVVLALVIAGVVALLLVPLVISLVKKNQRREELERRNIPVLEGDSTAEASEGTAEEAVGEISGETTPNIVTVPAVEQPESLPSRMQRLRARLAHSGGFGQALLAILSRGDLSAADWEELEDTLIMADVGLDATSEIMEGLRSRVKIESTTDPQRVREILREELLRHVGPDMDRSLNLTRSETDSGAVHPAAVLMVGVNGTGKTTTVGKLARLLRAQGTTVLLGAADTFRAAAADQLVTWGDRVGVDVVRSDREGADPASVAFDAVAQADATGVDVIIVDTAGRLQNKAGLMDELGKIKRVMERTTPVNEVLLVLDATTGQNGMQQARVFAEVTGLTGIVLTKLDGTAKGGIVISVQRELGVPVKLVGLGEGPDDLAPFDPEAFVDSLLS
ncbi:signal recognition particle-docking protein FtsY [Actinotignum sp. GS-2025f]|uniref:signal recognition particle-docking protein FtsY n=1 Tax=unclassified Actinotignum TaxID=2632702 RepID=UPI002A83188F|nr:signal recognition particle-docking protein FtsY [Actinotignum sp. SLA_B059]MDY5126952.1 signal recognition particle-docking protein FtsY [Actinotignum sp. SLA_B059]